MKTVLLICALIIGFGVVSERLHKSILTPPMVFVSVRLLVAAGWLGTFESIDGLELTRLLAELTLILVLFLDASRIGLRDFRRDLSLPFRLLAVGMPLTLLLGAGLAALLFPALSLWEVALLGAILAPTDAALGQAVVSSPVVPARIRQALNVESGLNDGLALPLVVILLAVGGMSAEPSSASEWIAFVVKQVLLGPLAGIAVGLGGGSLVRRAAEREWMSQSFQQLSAVALAILAYGVAELIEGNGFMAAFSAGIVVGTTARSVTPVLQEFAETEGQLLSLLTFLCFGSHLVWSTLPDMNGEVFLYAMGSLTVVRMLPVAVSLIGSGLMPVSGVFLGWFGPRGLASILFALLVHESQLPGRETIYVAVLATVLLSVFAHGLTAWPAANAYANRCDIASAEEQAEMMELQPVKEELPARIAFRNWSFRSLRLCGRSLKPGVPQTIASGNPV